MVSLLIHSAAITDGIDNCFYTCCSSVRPSVRLSVHTFQNRSKQIIFQRRKVIAIVRLAEGIIANTCLVIPCFVTELESLLSELNQQSKEVQSLKKDLEFAETEKMTKTKEMEKQLKSTRIEKEDLSRDLTEAQEKLKLQSKELKDALQQRKLAMSEYTEVTDK